MSTEARRRVLRDLKKYNQEGAGLGTLIYLD